MTDIAEDVEHCLEGIEENGKPTLIKEHGIFDTCPLTYISQAYDVDRAHELFGNNGELVCPHLKPIFHKVQYKQSLGYCMECGYNEEKIGEGGVL